MSQAVPRSPHPEDEVTEPWPRPSFEQEAAMIAKGRASAAAGLIIPDEELDAWLDDFVAGRPLRIPR